MIAAIVAVDDNFGIGSNNELLAHIPEDLKNFKKLTENNIVIMGRKTYDSLPNKPLPNRTNVVITSSPKQNESSPFFISMDSAKELIQSSVTDCFIIGGGMIYKEFLPYCDKVYLTKIHHSYENVDTYFQNIDDMSEWGIKMSSDIREYNDTKYQFCIYERGAKQNE